MLITNVSHQLLEEILESNQASGSPILIEHDSEVLSLSQHLEQQLVASLGRWRVHHRPQLRRALATGPEDVEDMHHANDLVDRAAEHRDATVPRLRDETRHFARMRGLINSEDGGPGRHHIGDLFFSEAHYACDDLRLGMLADTFELPFAEQILVSSSRDSSATSPPACRAKGALQRCAARTNGRGR